MMNRIEKEEKQYLEIIKEKLRMTLEKIDERVNGYAREMQE